MALPQPIEFDASQVSAWIGQVWWPAMRVGGFVAVAPIVSSASVPARVKIILSVLFALVISPGIRVPAGLEILSAAGMLTAVEQIVIGVAIGMVVQLAFDALELAGQTISMTMGLGYATLIDPQRGANTAVLGELFTMLTILVYLALDAHLALFAGLARSFQTLPIGMSGVDRSFFLTVANWGAHVFESGLLIALPATVALVVVNLALGVVTRAAPQLNLFGVGFPITMLAGYFVLVVGLDGVLVGIRSLIDSALGMVADLVDVPVLGAH